MPEPLLKSNPEIEAVLRRLGGRLPSRSGRCAFCLAELQAHEDHTICNVCWPDEVEAGGDEHA